MNGTSRFWSQMGPKSHLVGALGLRSASEVLYFELLHLYISASQIMAYNSAIIEATRKCLTILEAPWKGLQGSKVRWALEAKQFE